MCFHCNLDKGAAIDPTSDQMTYKGKLWITNHRKDVRPQGVLQHRVRQGQMVANFYIDVWQRQRVFVDIEV